MASALGLAFLLGLVGSAQVVEPGQAAERPHCEGDVALAVRAAEHGDLQAADEWMTEALRRCPRDPEVLREGAALRFRQGRLDEAQELAFRLLDQDARSEWAWELIASARYVGDDRWGALHAWNRIGRPQAREVRVTAAEPEGSFVESHPALARALEIRPGELITASALVRTERALLAIPAVTRARVDFRPEPGGSGSVEAAVALGRRHPFGSGSLPAHLLRGLTGSVRMTASNPAGMMERWDLAGMSEGRLRTAQAAVSYPASLGRGTAGWELVWTDGLFADPPGDPVRITRAGAAGSYGAWLGSAVHAGAWGGIDRWSGPTAGEGHPEGIFVRLGGQVRLAPAGDRWSLRVSGEGWTRRDRSLHFGRVGLRADRRYALREDTDLELHAGGDALSRDAPLDLYPRFGSGRSATHAMRARSVLGARGEVRPVRSGSAWTHGGVELRRWTHAPGRLPAGAISLGAALFVDAMRTVRASEAGEGAAPRGAVHIGVGLRARAPGAPGWFRFDWAVDPADGTSRISAAWVPGI